ncbi:MAG TPA: MFS transporter [Desulfobacteraceae bacterium]|nr:MFS transporter [Desulfobacteraceae bacterium]HPJ69071.1 MFS transporter [Desulfobacteraceae bacterium]HPQ29547.1 MFS transporter [Desulfobacteraceae bacterium]
MGKEMDDFGIERRTQWGRLFLLVGVGIVAAFQIGKAPPVLSMLRKELGLTLVLAGWVLSAFNIMGTLIAPVAGAIADWLGHRLLVIFGLGCMAVSSAIGSFSQGPSLLLVTRFFEGLGYTFMVVSVPGLILRVVNQRDSRVAFGFWGSFMPAGGAMMMILAPLLISVFGWRGMWLINGVLLFAFIIWVAYATRDLSVRKNKDRFSLQRLLINIWLTVKTPGPILLALCFGTYGFQLLVVMGFLPTLLIEQQGMNQGVASVLTAIALSVSVPGNLLGGWLLQRGIKRWILIAVASVTMGICSFGIFSGSVNILIRYMASIVFMGISGMLPTAVIFGAVAHAPSRELVATSNGILIQGAQFGLLTGPPIVAAAVSHSGDWGIAPWVLAIVALIGVGLSLCLRPLEIQIDMLRKGNIK